MLAVRPESRISEFDLADGDGRRSLNVSARPPFADRDSSFEGAVRLTGLDLLTHSETDRRSRDCPCCCREMSARMDCRSQDPVRSAWPTRAAPGVCPRGHRRPSSPDRQSVGSRSVGSVASFPRRRQSTRQTGPLARVVRAVLGRTTPCTYASRAIAESPVSWRVSERSHNDVCARPVKPAHRPATTRFSGCRSGARRRERVTIRSCCFRSKDSATMARAPSGRMSRTVVTTKRTKRTKRSRIGAES